MKVFPFSLDGAAKDWLYLKPTLFNTWGDMKRIFLEIFFLMSRTTTIRKEICRIRQHTGETLHEYWERFNKLCATCPHHQISEQLLIQYFYEGLSMMDKSMIDAASGGDLMDKTLATTRHLISNMASNTQQFGIRGPSQSSKGSSSYYKEGKEDHHLHIRMEDKFGTSQKGRKVIFDNRFLKNVTISLKVVTLLMSFDWLILM
ncbi:hypothetical protein CR513_02190, partial [Mucuna pruriens]